MSTLFIQITENDKRFFIAILLVFILVFVLIGYIGLLIQRVMRIQGKKIDDMMHDIVVARVVEDKKGFIRVARKKNWRYFIKKAFIPLMILIAAFILLLIAESVHEFKYNIFDSEKQGFMTLFFTWNFGDENIYKEFFGIRLIADWPPLANTPHFEVEALFSYFFLPMFLTGIIWYLIEIQALIARTIRMYRLSRSIYDKNLDDFNVSQSNQNAMNQNISQQNNNPNDINNANY